MEEFLEKNEEGMFEHVRNAVAGAAGDDEDVLERTWTQVRYLKRLAKVKLMEWWMRSDGVERRLDYWKMKKSESIVMNDEALGRTSDGKIGEARDDLFRCEAQKEEYRRKIEELGDLEESLDPYLQLEAPNLQ